LATSAGRQSRRRVASTRRPNPGSVDGSRGSPPLRDSLPPILLTRPSFVTSPDLGPHRPRRRHRPNALGDPIDQRVREPVEVDL
jgi:hypothetical protein